MKLRLMVEETGEMWESEDSAVLLVKLADLAYAEEGMNEREEDRGVTVEIRLGDRDEVWVSTGPGSSELRYAG